MKRAGKLESMIIPSLMGILRTNIAQLISLKMIRNRQNQFNLMIGKMEKVFQIDIQELVHLIFIL